MVSSGGTVGSCDCWVVGKAGWLKKLGGWESSPM